MYLFVRYIYIKYVYVFLQRNTYYMKGGLLLQNENMTLGELIVLVGFIIFIVIGLIKGVIH